MKIAVKTQTSRSTSYREGLNCVNLFLHDDDRKIDLALGLRVTEWGEEKEIEPIITVSVDGKESEFPALAFANVFKMAVSRDTK